jgi:deazaflavin-dependent oxidoreductase (nitroreductase family)
MQRATAPQPTSAESGPAYDDGRYVPERRGNPLIRTPNGGRLLSASQLPWFTALPPAGFGVLTTIGRRTGKTRRRCVRAIRRGDAAYLVAIGGEHSRWLKNVRAHPEVRLRIRGGRFTGVAREPRGAAEVEEAREAFCDTVNPFDYLECRMHRTGGPTREKIVELHRKWFEGGSPLVVELHR